MAIARKTIKTQTSKTTIRKPDRNLEGQPLELLLEPEQYEAITAANYDHPESRIILRCFLHVNYYWQVSRSMQGLPSPVTSVDWSSMERNAAQLIRNTFEKLLPGVETTAWNGRIPDKYEKV